MRARSSCIRSGQKKRPGQSHSSTAHGDQDKTDPSPAAARHIWGDGSGSRIAWEPAPHKTRQKCGPEKEPAEKIVKDIRRVTRRKFSAEEKVRIMPEGLRGKESIAELFRREGIVQDLYYRWSFPFETRWTPERRDAARGMRRWREPAHLVLDSLPRPQDRARERLCRLYEWTADVSFSARLCPGAEP